MSYLSALETARSHLDRGDLLAAEAAFDLAHELWSRSRVRAPLVERGLEPALRRIGGWFGRRSNRPVLPVFGHKASVLEDDLRALARLLGDEVQTVLSRGPEGLVEADRVVLENALRLDRESRFFGLDASERWRATRGYLDASRRLARRVEVDLLPADPAASQAEGWLRQWAEAVLDGGGVPSEALIRWIERQASAVGRLGIENAAAWYWVTARAALLDPQGGERALEAVQHALGEGLDPDDALVARRLLAGLLVNETVLAGPGADVDEALERWLPDPGVAATWPPPEIAELRRARRDVAPDRALVTAAWDDAAENLVLVLHDGERAHDALALAPRVEGADRATRFEASLPEARGWIQRWMPEGAVVLVPETPPPHFADLLTGQEVLDVGALTTVVDVPGVHGEPREPARPGAAHPLWSRAGGHAVYRPLADRGRSLVPHFLAWTRACPSISEHWGRQALTVMSEHGLAVCGTLRDAVDRLLGPEAGQGRARAMQTVDLVVPLEWPRLESRDWGGDSADDRGIDVLPSRDSIPRTIDRSREGSLWFSRVAGVEELASIAAASDRAEVLTRGRDRARELADAVASRVDRRRVTAAPSRVVCPEALLRQLDEWMRSAIGDPARQFDVLWLWRLLAETANGEVDLDSIGADRAPVADLVKNAPGACGEGCRLTAHEGCWDAQLQGRREVSKVWIVGDVRSPWVLEECEDLLVDDLRRFTVGEDSEASALLDRVVEATLASTRAWVFGRAGRLDAALRAMWTRRVPRPLHQGGEASGEQAAVLLVPPGYRLGDPLIGGEAARLLELRTAEWNRVGGGRSDGHAASIWWDPMPATPADAVGETNVPHAVTARLVDDATDDDLLLLARAAAAQSRARQGWACLDARLTHVLDHPGGNYPDVDAGASAWDASQEDAVRTTTLEGRVVLGEKAGRVPSSWTHPITAERLETAGRDGLARTELGELAEVLHDWGRGRPLILGGATDRQRACVVDLLRGFADRSGDGGPLGIRCVMVVAEPSGETDSRRLALGAEDADRLGAVMLEAERGRTSRVDLHPSLLRDEALRAWARRVSSVAWVFPRLDGEGTDPGTDIVPVLPAWREILERSGAAALGFVDDVDDDARGGLARLASVLDARRAVLPAAVRRDAAWDVAVTTVGPLVVACWSCTRSVEIEDAAARCPSCDAAVVDRPGALRAAAAAAEDALVTRLHAHSETPWWALTADAELAARMRQRLSLDVPAVDQAPLLAAVAAEPDDPRVLHVDELAGLDRPPAELLWLDLPESADEVRRVLRRLAAMESAATRLTLLLPPLGLWMATPRPLRGRWRWAAKRTEVEFRLRELEARTSSSTELVGLRPESLGPALRGDIETRRNALLGASAYGPPRAADLVDALEAAGIAFGASQPNGLDFTRLPATVDDADVIAFLDWARELGVMEGPRPVAPPHARANGDFERALREIGPPGLSATTLLDAHAGRRVTEKFEVPEEGIRIGVGRSTDSWLHDSIVQALGLGIRVLVVVSHAAGRSRWQDRLPGGADVVDVDELAMAVLDSVARERGVRARVRSLPPSGSAEGEEARLRLMRESSRRYAQVTGRIPSLEAQDLRRAVQGEAREIPVNAVGDVDLELLDRCAAEARAEAGWLTASELREASANAIASDPDLVERWRRRYPRVAIEGLQDVPEALLAFVRALFPPSQCWQTQDPLLGPDPDARAGTLPSRALETELPREIVRAIESLRRHEPDDLGRLRSKGRARSRHGIERVRVLTLRAAAEWILENVDAEREPDRTGVVVAREDDRHELGAALRRNGLETLAADVTAGLVADGPRHVLAALHLVRGEATVGLLDVIASLDPSAVSTPSDERFARWSAAGSSVSKAPVDVAELRLNRIHALRGRLEGSPRVGEAVEELVRAGVLDGLVETDAASGRMRAWLDDHRHRSVDEVLGRIDAALLVDSAAPRREIRLLSPDDLAGPDFDHLIAIGTGFEPAQRNVRVLLRAPERVTLLYSERDPLA